MSVPYRAIILQKPYFADLLSQIVDMEFCLCIYQSSFFRNRKTDKSRKYVLETMDHRSLQYCNYNEELINTIPPVDRDILDSMKVYESEILSMIYRWLNLSQTEAKEHYYQHLKFWSWYLKNKKINLFIGVVPHETYYSVIYYLCKLMSIKTILFHPLSISNSFTLMYDWRAPDYRVSILTQEYLKKSTIKSVNTWSSEFADFINNQTLCTSPIYMKQTFEKIKSNKLLDFLIYLNYKSKLNMQLANLILKGLLIFMYECNKVDKIHINRIGSLVFELYYENLCTVLDKNHLGTEPYIYISLHYQPECTTLPLGDFFENQKIMIEWLAHSRPQDVWLYIREHPSQTYTVNTSRYRHPSFYNDILKIPRVRLVSRRCSSFDLIKNSLCVSTITGTVTLESLYHEKPVLFFGYHVYQYAPGVFPVRSLSDCSSALKKIYNQEISLEKENFLLYLKVLEENSIQLDWEELEKYLEKDDEKRKKFIDSFTSFINFSNNLESQAVLSCDILPH
ncbi:capsular polysaccharide export protein, LipB/KpsS family [Thermosynechococcus sp. FA-CM-4201]